MKKAGSGGTRPANIWVNPSLPETGKDKKTFGQIILNEPKHHKSMNFYTRYRPVRKKRGTVLQTLLVMKLIFLLVTIACLHVTAASYAQKITLNEKNEPLDKVFNDIKKQSGYIFFYNNNVLTGTTKVSLTLKDATLQEALDQTLNGQPLEYAIVDKTIVIKKRR